MQQQITNTNQGSILTYLNNPKFKEQLQSVLPKYLTPDRMIRIALTELRSTPKLSECNPLSFVGAIIRCAQMGLEPSSERGYVYLIPFYNSKNKQNECKIMIGYRGMLYLAAKSSIHIESGIVYANDQFEIEKGLNIKLSHKPSIDKEPGDLKGVYAFARLGTDIPPLVEYMRKSEIDEIMVKATQGKTSTPWQTDCEAMARKTVIRRLFKYLPMSDAIEYAVSADEQGEINTQNNANLVDDSIFNEVEVPISTSRAESLAMKLEDATSE